MTNVADLPLVLDAANRLTAICEHFETYGEWPRNRSDSSDIADLRAVLAWLRQLEGERDGRLAQAYTSGWYDTIEAYRGPGWAEREAGWQKYREAVRAEFADHSDTAKRQDADCDRNEQSGDDAGHGDATTLADETGAAA